MRAVLFYLLPERYVDPDDQAWSYLLAELPTFLFFSAFTILIYIWARAINSKDEQRKRAVLIGGFGVQLAHSSCVWLGTIL